MIIKYKVSEVAKDLNKPAKQIVDMLAALGGEPKKVGANLDEAELNYVFERLTQESAEADLSEYLDSAPKPKPKESEILKKADGTVVEMPRPKHKAEKKPKTEAPATKREVVTKVVASLVEQQKKTFVSSLKEKAQAVYEESSLLKKVKKTGKNLRIFIDKGKRQ